ncbi:MAG: hypothetical protein GYB66_12075 [Chloroflexi bacterium]|nr:hypothetical protein [Chloroflexota bacterium]
MLLSGCSSGVYSLAYVARGDSTNLLGLTKTVSFPSNEDLNVIVKLNEHDDPVDVEVTFYRPDGEIENTLQYTAVPGVGTVVLGLDWEQKQENSEDEERWVTGRWIVKIKIDGEEVDELDFRVN